MTDDIAYTLGFAHGYRKQPYLDKFFEATLEYFQYKQGYLSGVAEANRESDRHNDQRARHQRLDSPQTNRTVHSKAKELHRMA
jgi:hypothetical protein